MLTGMDDCVKAGCNFCVQTGAANEVYFRDQYKPDNLPIVGKENIKAQIEGIIDGSCDAVELTKEDLFKWTNLEYTDARRCTPQIIGIPIVRRHRGMMAGRKSPLATKNLLEDTDGLSRGSDAIHQ